MEAIISLVHGPATARNLCHRHNSWVPVGPRSRVHCLYVASPCPGRQIIETNLYTQPLYATIACLACVCVHKQDYTCTSKIYNGPQPVHVRDGMMGYMYVTYFMIERTGRGERQAATGWTGGRQRQAGGRQRQAGQEGGRQRQAGQEGGRQRQAGQEGGRQRQAGQQAATGWTGVRQQQAGQEGGRQQQAGQEAATGWTGGRQAATGWTGGRQAATGWTGGSDRMDRLEAGSNRLDRREAGSDRLDRREAGSDRLDRREAATGWTRGYTTKISPLCVYGRL